MPGPGRQRRFGRDRQVHRGQLRHPEAPLSARGHRTDVAAARLLNQQLVRPRFTTPTDVVGWFGAVQAQDYRGSLWAVGQRLPSATEAEVEHAVASRAIVRTWPLRRTLHFVAAEDVRWMLRLLAPRLISGNVGRYRQLELDAKVLARSGRILGRALEGGRCLTRPQAYAALTRGGVSPAGQRGIHILAHLSQHGLLCFGPRQGSQPTFVLLDDWVSGSADRPRDEARAELAVRYFASHGPATLRDFVWWSGLLVKDARAGIEDAGPRLVEEKRDERSFWAAPAERAGKWPGPMAALLPPWDECVVAYKDREAALGDLASTDERLRMVVGNSLILVDGRVRGTWKRSLSPSTVTLTLDYWTRATGSERRAVEAEAARYGSFLGKGVRIIRTGGRTRP